MTKFGRVCIAHIEGKTTAEIASASEFVVMATVDTKYRPIVGKSIYAPFGSQRVAIFRISTDRGFRIGYSSKDGSYANITEGTAIYTDIVYIANIM